MKTRLFGLIAALALGASTFVGSAEAVPPSGTCPEGWSEYAALGPDDPFDTNGDGIICIKELPNANGLGNSGQRAGTEDVGHVPGHNHKDNSNPIPAP